MSSDKGDFPNVEPLNDNAYINGNVDTVDQTAKREDLSNDSTDANDEPEHVDTEDRNLAPDLPNDTADTLIENNDANAEAGHVDNEDHNLVPDLPNDTADTLTENNNANAEAGPVDRSSESSDVGISMADGLTGKKDASFAHGNDCDESLKCQTDDYH